MVLLDTGVELMRLGWLRGHHRCGGIAFKALDAEILATIALDSGKDSGTVSSMCYFKAGHGILICNYRLCGKVDIKEVVRLIEIAETNFAEVRKMW